MRRLITLSAVALTLIAAYIFFIMPLPGKRNEIHESLQSKYSTLKKYETFLNAAGKTDAEFDALIKEIEKTEANALQGANEALALARLQGHVQDFAEKSGIRIISIRPLSMVKYKHYSSLPLQLEASGAINQLSDFIKHIDESNRLIRIEKLNINVVNLQTPGELRIRMQISGLMKA